MPGQDLPVDQDGSATWRQLRDRLREIRQCAEALHADGEHALGDVLAILNRPRETS